MPANFFPRGSGLNVPRSPSPSLFSLLTLLFFLFLPAVSAGVAAPAAGLEDGLAGRSAVFADAGQLALVGATRKRRFELLSVQPRFLLAVLMADVLAGLPVALQ